MRLAIVNLKTKKIDIRNIKDVDAAIYDITLMTKLIISYMAMFNYTLAYKKFPNTDREYIDNTVEMVMQFNYRYPDEFANIITQHEVDIENALNILIDSSDDFIRTMVRGA